MNLTSKGSSMRTTRLGVSFHSLHWLPKEDAAAKTPTALLPSKSRSKSNPNP